MLVLSRRVNESIVIDNTISITVLSSEQGKVRLGITVPEDVAVQRGEICHLQDVVSPPHVVIRARPAPGTRCQ